MELAHLLQLKGNMNDKEKLALRHRIERIKHDKKQRDLIDGTLPLWNKYKILDGIENEEVRRNCVCALDNQRGYNELFNVDDTFRRISVPVVRRLFKEFKIPVKSHHEGFIDKVERVRVPAVRIECSKEFTADLTAFSFIKDQYHYQPYMMLDRECEDSITLVARLAYFIEDLTTEFATSGETLLFLGIGWDEGTEQLLLYADLA